MCSIMENSMASIKGLQRRTTLHKMKLLLKKLIRKTFINLTVTFFRLISMVNKILYSTMRTKMRKNEIC
jgi:hypothetical protein